MGNLPLIKAIAQGVIIYPAGLVVAALTFAIGSALALFNPDPDAMGVITPLYTCFSLALGVSLLTIHIYMIQLHRALQVFWLIGSIASLIIGHFDSRPFAITVYDQPLTLFGVGFTFVALTGIFFKEGFCFNRLETKILTPIVPILLLGHLTGILPIQAEQVLLGIWAIFFLVFAFRKVIQEIPQDIGDKSVFAHLHKQA